MGIQFFSSAKESAIFIVTCLIVLPLFTLWVFFRNLFTFVVKTLFGLPTIEPRATELANNPKHV